MRRCLKLFVAGSCFISFAATQNVAGQSSREEKPMNSSKIAPDGTAFVTRIVPVPTTISPEAQKVLARPASDAAVPETLAERRRKTDGWQNRTAKVFQAKYPVTVEEKEIAGVPVRIIAPVDAPAS